MPDDQMPTKEDLAKLANPEQPDPAPSELEDKEDDK